MRKGGGVVRADVAQHLDGGFPPLEVGRVQRHLLPARLPPIDGLELGASYHTSSRAGGDYYDVLPLPEEQWGFLVADVSGHGTPAAVEAPSAE